MYRDLHYCTETMRKFNKADKHNCYNMLGRIFSTIKLNMPGINGSFSDGILHSTVSAFK